MMKRSLMTVLKILFRLLCMFGILGIIISLTDPTMGLFGIVFYCIWSVLSLLAYRKICKASETQKKQPTSYSYTSSTKPIDSGAQCNTFSSMNNSLTSKSIGTETAINRTRISQSSQPTSIQSPSQHSLHSQEQSTNSTNKQAVASERKTVFSTTTEKIGIRPEQLDYSSVIQRYLSTSHSAVPAIYDYYSYHQAEFSCLLNNIPKHHIVTRTEVVQRNKVHLSPFEQSATITKRTARNAIANFVVVDTETTGLTPAGNDIIEISAIKFDNFIPVSTFSTLLKPRNPIPPDATRINGITNEMVQSAPSFSEIKSSLEDFIGEYPIIAHNAAFDIKFLHASGLQFRENAIFYDTLELSRKHIRDCMDGSKLENYKLTTVCNECSIYFSGAHRSTADALATGLLFIEIIKTIFDVEDIFAIKFCKEPLNSSEELDDWDYYQHKKPIKTFTVTSREEFDYASNYESGDEVEQGYDDVSGKSTLEIDYEQVCYTPKSIQTFFDTNYGDYRMFVLKAYETDDFKVKIQIGIYVAK